MIVAIEGKIVKKEPTLLHLKTQSGLTYEVKISLHCSASIENEIISLATTQIIKEDSHTLFGFISESEKIMFDRVIKINGVGPSTALAICSTFTPEQFSQALIASDVNTIKKVPGIGPKSAKRILVELSDFNFQDTLSDTLSVSKNEAFMALESLGFKKESIKKVLSSAKSESTSDLIKEALKQLGR
jgi:Holliday junction DNA helicase RuvA